MMVRRAAKLLESDEPNVLSPDVERKLSAEAAIPLYSKSQ
jgi:hypothetical protein